MLEDVENFDRTKRLEYEHKVAEKKRLADIAVIRAENEKKKLEEYSVGKKERETLRRRKARRRQNREGYQQTPDVSDNEKPAEDVENKSDG